MLVLVASLAWQAASSPLPAAAPPPPTPTATVRVTAHPQLDRDAVVCRRDNLTGSHIASSTCHTRAQWDLMSDSAKDALSRSTQSTGGKFGPT